MDSCGQMRRRARKAGLRRSRPAHCRDIAADPAGLSTGYQRRLLRAGVPQGPLRNGGRRNEPAPPTGARVEAKWLGGLAWLTSLHWHGIEPLSAADKGCSSPLPLPRLRLGRKRGGAGRGLTDFWPEAPEPRGAGRCPRSAPTLPSPTTPAHVRRGRPPAAHSRAGAFRDPGRDAVTHTGGRPRLRPADEPEMLRPARFATVRRRTAPRPPPRPAPALRGSAGVLANRARRRLKVRLKGD